MLLLLFNTGGSDPGAASVIEALIRAFEADAALTATTADGKLWESLPPPGTSYPFAVAEEVSHDQTHLFRGGYAWVEVQVRVFAPTYQLAKARGKTIAAGLHGAALTVNGTLCKDCRFLGALKGPADFERGPNGNADLHQQVLRFQVLAPTTELV